MHVSYVQYKGTATSQSTTLPPPHALPYVPFILFIISFYSSRMLLNMVTLSVTLFLLD